MRADFETLARGETLPRLNLIGNDSRILRLSDLRPLPSASTHQRINCLAQWRGRRVFVKIFLGRRNVRAWRRGAKSSRELHRAGVPTPKLLRALLAPERCFALTLFEYLDDAVHLRELGSGADQATLRHLARCVLDTSAAAIAAGYCQSDDHPNNYLFKGDKSWLIDTDTLRPTTVHASPVRNWRKLIARADFSLTLPVGFRHLMLSAALDAGAPRHLVGAARRECARHIRRFMRDERHAGRRVNFGRNRRGHVDETLNNEAVKAAIAASEMMDAGHCPSEVVALKHGGANSVLRVDLPMRTLVVKRYPRKHLLHRLMHIGCRSRARRCYFGARALEFLSVARTPKALAFIEERRFFLLERAWLITEYSPGVPMAEIIADDVEPSGLDHALTRLLAALSAAGVAHGNLEASNLIVSSKDNLDADDLQLSDLDAIRFGASRRRLREDCRRLLANWAPDSEFARKLNRGMQSPLK